MTLRSGVLLNISNRTYKKCSNDTILYHHLGPQRQVDAITILSPRRSQPNPRVSYLRSGGVKVFQVKRHMSKRAKNKWWQDTGRIRTCECFIIVCDSFGGNKHKRVSSSENEVRRLSFIKQLMVSNEQKCHNLKAFTIPSQICSMSQKKKLSNHPKLPGHCGPWYPSARHCRGEAWFLQGDLYSPPHVEV